MMKDDNSWFRSRPQDGDLRSVRRGTMMLRYQSERLLRASVHVAVSPDPFKPRCGPWSVVRLWEPRYISARYQRDKARPFFPRSFSRDDDGESDMESDI